MNFAVIGLGSFGIKRAQAIKNSKIANLLSIHDTSIENLNKAKEIYKVAKNSKNTLQVGSNHRFFS